MKRKPNHSLKRLREIIGKNQVQLAGMLGVSVDLIKSVETGRAPLTENLSERIEAATGAMVGETGWKWIGKRVVWTWKPFTDGTLLASRWAYSEAEMPPPDWSAAMEVWSKAWDDAHSEPEDWSEQDPAPRIRTSVPKRRKSKPTGMPFDREVFDHWIKNQGRSNDDTAKQALETAWPWMRALFNAAAKPGKAGLARRVPALERALWEWIIDQDERFKLGLDFNADDLW